MAPIEPRQPKLWRIGGRLGSITRVAVLRLTRTTAMHRRPALCVGALLGVVALSSALAATSARADPCHKPLTATPPNCQAQAQAGISYTGWETKGWAYYCSGDHPYYWLPHFEGNNGCFSAPL